VLSFFVVVVVVFLTTHTLCFIVESTRRRVKTTRTVAHESYQAAQILLCMNEDHQPLSIFFILLETLKFHVFHARFSMGYF
jgi:hypothetical protein